MDKEQVLELENMKVRELRNTLTEMHVQDIADVLESIESPVGLVKVFKVLPKDMGADVFAYVDSDVQERIVHALTDRELGVLMEELYTDDAVDFVEEMPANVVERVLRASTKETRATINKFLKYEEYSAGSIMTTEFIDVKENMSCRTALKRVKRLAVDMETINVMYVTDSERVLKGVLTIRDIIMAEDDDKVGDIMQENIVFAETDTDQEEVIKIFRQYGFLALPIVDK